MEWSLPLIIDAHAHVGDWSETRFAGEFSMVRYRYKHWSNPNREWTKNDMKVDVEQMIRTMDKAGVDKSVIWGMFMKPYGIDLGTQPVVDAAKKYPNRFIPFHTVDPIGREDSVRSLKSAVKDHGFKGVKIYAAYNNLKPNDHRIVPVYRAAEELGIPAVVHMGFTTHYIAKMEFHDPVLLDDVATAFPDLRLVAAHVGFHEWKNYFLLMLRHNNLYADTTNAHRFPVDHAADMVRWAKHLRLLDRLMMGSDYPLNDPAQVISVFKEAQAYVEERRLKPALTDQDMGMFFGENARRIYDVSK